ncbi:MAG TPA: sugar ABC transporter permease, partial [Nocardioidaceae bacterium]
MPQRQVSSTTEPRERRVVIDGPPLGHNGQHAPVTRVRRTDRRPSGVRMRRKPLVIALFLLPALCLYLLLVILPIIQGIHYSLYHWNGLEPLTNFVGLQNYRTALADPVFTGALKHNVVIVVLSLVIQLPFALGLAVLLNQRIHARALLRLLFFLPFVLSEVITGVIWRLLLKPDGLVDKSFHVAGLGSLVHEWLADPSIVLYTLFFVISWKYFGFHMVLFLAGLQQIPHELHEAAAIDGATQLQVFRHVTLPLLGPTIRISVFLSIIGSLQLFDLVWVMTGGGPVNASNTMAVYMIDHSFKRFQFG